ncbi:MAG: pyridoxamine 5'-phosphate oxidase family protein [Clostridiales bacterium]|nr:pyridoxamine 5'-phosphate oxidase family protein [Clostridiales bacterium]
MNYPEMRRKEKELSTEKAQEIITQVDFGVLSLCNNQLPYGVPLNPVLNDNILYFHCAHTGFKIDLIKQNAYGHFVFVSKHKVLKDKATTAYESAMVHGLLRFVEDIDERKLAYKLLIDRYMDSNIKAGQETIIKYDKATTIIAMDIKGITAKANR